MSTKTSNYTYDLIENYYLKNLTEQNFWLFGSRSQRENVTTTLDSNKELFGVLSKTVFGVELNPLDFSFMLRSIFWESGIIYDKYDDAEVLSSKPFYAIVEPDGETGSYEVFKCISNNYGSPSTAKPQIDASINNVDGLYNLSDGYIWKYMTSIPFLLFKKFSARGFVPIPRNQQVESIASDGINFIEVENFEENFGYQKLEGTINSQTGNNIYRLNVTGFFEVINGYRNSVLYVESQEAGVKVYDITGSRQVGQTLEVTLSGDIFTDFNQNDSITIQVLPKIVIRGNGQNANAIPTFNSNGTRINGIRILDPGEGYTIASATVIDPSYFSQAEVSAVRVRLRPIISPEGGHGANVIKELRSKTIGISGSISSLGTSVTDTGSYTNIALVKNPNFSESFGESSFDNRLKVELAGANPTAALVVGDEVSQIQGNETIRGIIHEIEDNNTIYLVDYIGPHQAKFDSSFQLIVRNSVLNINNIQESDYESGTGNIFYVTDFLPVERSSDKTEQIKLLIDF